MKKLLFLVVTMLYVIVCRASDNGYKSIVFHQIDGDMLAITFEDDMLLKIEDNNIILSCHKGVIEVPFENLKYWNYLSETSEESPWDSTDDTNNETVGISVGKDYIKLTNLPDEYSISLISIDGRVVATDKVSDLNEVFWHSLNHGIYVLNYNDTAIKIVLK